MKKVLVRYYNKANLGDDLFLQILNIRYKNKLTVPTQTPLQLIHADDVYIYRNLLVKFFYRVVGKITGTNNRLISWLSKKNDMMIYVGGSLFMEKPGMDAWRKERLFYEHLPVPYYIIGSNIGPYDDPNYLPLVRDIFAGAQDVCLRDKASFKLAGDLPSVRLGTDMVFGMDTSSIKVTDEKRAIFSLINCRDRFDPDIAERYEIEIMNMTLSLISQGYEVVYMSFCKYEGDELANKNALNRLDEVTRRKIRIYNYDGDLTDSIALIAASSIIVGTRFHAVILGCLFGKKVLPISYNHKTLNILRDIKFQGKILDLNRKADFNGSSFDFHSIPITKVSNQKKLAEEQFQELDKVLEKRN